MDVIGGTDYDGVSHGDLVEYGQTADVGGGAYYQSLMRQQLAQNNLVEQVRRDDTEVPLSTTWDAQAATPDHVRALEYKHAGVPRGVKKPKHAEPTVRLRKAMGLPLRNGELMFDETFKKGLPIS
jgi:hypothetical protein|eukprot:COSAG06_NODE_369_length_16731_cov_5.684644_8_plen_125_part_00